MAWNEPGGSKDKDPWGNRDQNQGPPDLDDVVRKMQEKLGGLFGGKGKKDSGSGGGSGPSRGSVAGMLGIVVVVAAVWLVYDSIHIIQPAERGVVLRLGKYVHTMQPGLNMTWPRPIAYVERVDVDQIRNEEIGYRSAMSRSAKGGTVPTEALMLTRDENIIDVQFAVQYRVKSAPDYLFNVQDPNLTLREATESAIREVVGKSTMDFVLTEGRSDIVFRGQELIQETLDRYQTGLVVTSVNMQDAQPPAEVQHAFDDAVKAREDEQRLINEAEAYSNDVLPKARGAAARMIEEANAYKASVIAKAEGESQRFDRVLTEYQKSPEVTRKRLYLETMESVLAKSSKVVIDVEGGNNMMFLPLDRLIGQAGRDRPLTADPSSFGSTLDSALDSAKQTIQRERDSLRSRERR